MFQINWILFQEAAELSSLKPELDELGVPLYAVVKEDAGTEVQNFKAFFKGEVFLDEKVQFNIYVCETFVCSKRLCVKKQVMKELPGHFFLPFVTNVISCA